MEVSIIIPVFNNLSVIQQTIKALKEQTYPNDKFEVIVVDNGSSDGSYEYLLSEDNIILILQTEHLGSPYSCRNRGIEAAKSNVIVFLDSTCIPENDFVEKGLDFIKNTECDLFGGNIIFSFSGKITAGKVCDSIINVQMKKSIIERGVAKTGNLWVKRYVFEEVGVFLEGVRSGDDVGFTTRCKEKGMKLVFCEDCVTYYAARGFKALMIKQYRVGKGKARLWYSRGVVRMVNESWKLLLPALPSSFKKLFDGNMMSKYHLWMLIKVYFVLYISRQATFWGITNEAALLKKNTKKYKNVNLVNTKDLDKTVDINKIILGLVDKYIVELNENGFITGGHNGPYYDKDTNVRNTAHYAIIFSYIYKLIGEEKYYHAVKKCGDYLVSNEAIPYDSNFYCRQTSKKDMCNGTIGAAWAIEGLVEAYKVIKDDVYLKTAQDVFELFPYDTARNAWVIVDTDGSKKTIDMTFNHQLWLAAAGVQILSVCQNNNIKKKCNAFFNNIEKMFKTYPNGLVKHSMYIGSSAKDSLINTARRCRYLLRRIKTAQSMKYKENGYHLFNIYAFAIVREKGWEIPLFKTKKFSKALDYCFSEELYEWLENRSIHYDINRMTKVKNNIINIYGYPYNAPGFELSYIYKVFKKSLQNHDTLVNDVIKKQIKLTYNIEAQSFNKNCEDSRTLDARIYEYVRGIM